MMDTAISISILVSLILISITLISITLMITGFKMDNKALKIISYFISFLTYVTFLNFIFNFIIPIY